MNKKQYVRWLARRVNIDMSQNVESSYVLLMTALADKEFYSVIPMDENRIGDGLSLRKEYCEEDSDELCSLLEVMVSLALRCERDILAGVATAGDIFWDMLDNLGLCEFTDIAFDPDKVDYILDRLLDRGYESDGAGGLFYAGEFPNFDMKREEIWWQMNIYAMRKYDQIELY